MQKKTLKQQQPENPKGMSILALRPLAKSLQSTGKRVFRDGTDRRLTDIATSTLNRPRGPRQYKCFPILLGTIHCNTTGYHCLEV